MKIYKLDKQFKNLLKMPMFVMFLCLLIILATSFATQKDTSEIIEASLTGGGVLLSFFTVY